MRKFIVGSLMFAILFGILASTSVYAADSTELQLYMGIKAKYVWKDPEPDKQTSANMSAGEIPFGAAGYVFTTKDSSELVAQALSDNHASVSDGFIRQLPMRDLVKMLTTIKSAADILKERNRDDLLALAYMGGYKAPEHKVVSNTNAAYDVGMGSDIGSGRPMRYTNTPTWALTGDIGQLGEYFPLPLAGKINILSPFGEPYVIGNTSYDASEVVFDTTKNNKVFAVVNGYVSYIGRDVIELMTYDQQVTVRYRGVTGLDGVVAGTVFSQGEQIGVTSDFTVGVSFRVASVLRNLLQAYPEVYSKEWYTVWKTKYPHRVQDIVLNEGDSHYHITANELPADKASSYINPEDFGVNPNAKQ